MGFTDKVTNFFSRWMGKPKTVVMPLEILNKSVETPPTPLIKSTENSDRNFKQLLTRVDNILKGSSRRQLLKRKKYYHSSIIGRVVMVRDSIAYVQGEFVWV